MQPLVMGTSNRPLTGVYSPATGKRNNRGVVICPPLGQEMIRSHRSCRVLASKLAASGFDVLRFDYYCTGESGGETEGLTLAGAIDDAIVAIEEIQDLSGARRVTVVGLRLGSLIGAFASSGRRSVDRLVLWDPVARGEEYVRDYIRSGVGGGAEGSFETEGFVYTAAFQAELAAAAIEDAASMPKNVLLILSQPEEGFEPLRTHLDGLEIRADVECLPNEPTWSAVGDIGVGSIPADIISRIASWT